MREILKKNPSRSHGAGPNAFRILQVVKKYFEDLTDLKARSLATWALIGLLAFTAAGALSLVKLKTEYSILQFLPQHHPAIVMDQNVRTQFHLTDLPLFVNRIQLGPNESGSWLETARMAQLTKLTEDVQALAGVDSVVSLANVSGATETQKILNIGPLVKITPPQDWSKRILGDLLLTPSLITKDGRTTLIFVQLNQASVTRMVEIEKILRSKLSQTFPNSAVSLGGVPAVQTDLGLLLNKELGNFILLTIFACAITLMIIFRTLSTILIPLILTAVSNILVFGMMSVAGLPFTILTATVPILVFITVVSLSAHFLLRFSEEEHSENIHPANQGRPRCKRWHLLWESHRAIWLPNLLGALTTCVGFLTLLSGRVPMIRDYGLTVALAVMLSWLLTSFGLIPLVMLFPNPRPREWVMRPARWALWSIHFAKPICLTVVIVVVGLVIGARDLHWTGKLFDDLPENQEARRSTELIDSEMGGVIPMEIVIHARTPGVWSQPSELRELDRLVQEFRQTPGVGSAMSLPDFIHPVEHLQHPILANSSKALSEIFFLYSFSEKDPIDNFLTDQKSSVRISLRLHDLKSDEMQRLVQQLQQKTQSRFPRFTVEAGGMGAIVHLIHDELSHELIFGFWQALLIAVILLGLVFKSARWALVASLPNLIPPIALLGYLSLTQTPIKPGIAIIFSIALGLAFNNTVYGLNRLRALRTSTRPLPVRKAFYLEANPCLVSTLIMMFGFSVFMFSYFSLNRTFGICMIVSILAGVIGDLVFLPGMISIFPRLLGHSRAN